MAKNKASGVTPAPTLRRAERFKSEKSENNLVNNGNIEGELMCSLFLLFLSVGGLIVPAN